MPNHDGASPGGLVRRPLPQHLDTDALSAYRATRRLLIDERNALARTHSDQLALLNLNVSAARERLVALEGGGVIELDVVREQ